MTTQQAPGGTANPAVTGFARQLAESPAQALEAAGLPGPELVDPADALVCRWLADAGAQPDLSEVPPWER